MLHKSLHAPAHFDACMHQSPTTAGSAAEEHSAMSGADLFGCNGAVNIHASTQQDLPMAKLSHALLVGFGSRRYGHEASYCQIWSHSSSCRHAQVWYTLQCSCLRHVDHNCTLRKMCCSFFYEGFPDLMCSAVMLWNNIVYCLMHEPASPPSLLVLHFSAILPIIHVDDQARLIVYAFSTGL